MPEAGIIRLGEAAPPMKPCSSSSAVYMTASLKAVFTVAAF